MKRESQIYNGELMSNDSELDQLLYVFERHHDIELEAGLVVEEAGTDIVAALASKTVLWCIWTSAAKLTATLLKLLRL
jgi:hypothetical protein